MRLKSVIVVAAMATSAHAGLCVKPDARDRLTQDEIATALQVFENALLAAGEVLAPCDETWSIAHVRLGASVQIVVVTPHGAVTGSAPAFEALAPAYDGIVWRALALRATPILGAPDPRPETPAQPPTPPTPPPTADASKGAFYVRIGYAIAPGIEATTSTRFGPAIGLGYRRPLDNWLFDLSILNTHAWSTSSSSSGDYDVNMLSFGRIAAMRVSPIDDTSAMYYGGGVSFGQTTIAREATGYTQKVHGYNVQAEAAIGYEALRNRSVRVFFEAWLTLPVGQIAATDYTGLTQVESKYWAPTLSLWGGLGF